ncbi:hypothetical protein OG423_14075 [Micromonospora zamorensis]|uniref:hypothetical protein n=1 Tax=Micromonospora zamorensis TaxID=709883 RepID=UPI00352B4D92|nr:hypothetical protein OG423_14075 [Micromonospora zamorensis]
MTKLRNVSTIAGVALALGAVLAAGSASAPATATPQRPQPAEQLIPACLAEDGGPQPVCIWDSAVSGNGLPAAPKNVVILYVSRPGQDPEAFRLK